MKSTEFRIGNLVDCFMVVEIVAIEEKKLKVRREIEKGYYNIELCPIDSLDLNPIPLTEEWLLKMGFEKKNETYKLKNFGKFIFHEIGISFYPAGILNSLLRKDLIIYVHQLQNLYFALTGEELTFSTPKINSQTQAPEY
jgi:hypothetical protein